MKRGLRQLRLFTVVAVLVAAVAVLVVATLVVAADAQTKVQASYVSLDRILRTVSQTPGNELTLTDFNRLRDATWELASALSSARSQVSFLRTFSSLNEQLDLTMHSLDVAVEMSSAAGEMLNGLQPTLFFLVSGEDSEAVVAQISSGERLVELLNLGMGQFLSAQQRLNRAREMLDEVDLVALPASSVLTVDQLRDFYGRLEQLNSILLQLPDLLEVAFGLTAAGESSYLVLSQNNDELRPSGGFISTYGWLVVRNGRVTDYNYSPSGANTLRSPSAELADQINPPAWWVRYREPIYMAWDGSWYADFPSTARMATWFYNGGNNPRSPVDGVIAIDITGFLYLLQALGDVNVPSYNVVVNAANFRQVVYDIRAFSPGVEPHKEFIAAVYRAIFERWQEIGVDAELSSQVLGAALRALQEKHIMLYFANEDLNQAVELLGWAGEQETGVDHDYLMVADANMGNKSNYSILRQLTYDVDLQTDGSVRGRTTVLYDYPERVAAVDPAVNPEFHGPRDYFNILQMFVPLNTQLNSATDNTLRPTQVYTTPTHTSFVTLMTVPYNFSERYQVSYATPPLVEPFGTNWRYRLLIQKQPGTRGEALNVQITLPPGARALEVTPSPDAQYRLERELLEFQLDLTVDRWIEVVYAQ